MTRKSKNTSVNSTTACPEEEPKTSDKILRLPNDDPAARMDLFGPMMPSDGANKVPRKTWHEYAEIVARER